MPPITRRRTLQLGIPASVGVFAVRPAAAEPIDGKGNDVCPCFFGVDAAELDGDRTIAVSGPCAVANPPETVTVSVRVSGDDGARAVGHSTFECAGRENDEDKFSVAAAIRGANRFEAGEAVVVDARVHINADDAPTITGRWRWSGTLA